MLSRRLSRPAAFWSVAALLVLLLAASGVPSPLYRVYQERFGFGDGALTAVFGVHAFALLATLLTVGALSDHLGRRPVLAAGLALQAVAMALFLGANGLGGLSVPAIAAGLAASRRGLAVVTGVYGAAVIALALLAVAGLAARRRAEARQPASAAEEQQPLAA